MEESPQNREAEFYNVYNEKVKPQLYKYENKRVAELKKHVKNVLLRVVLPGLIVFIATTLILLYAKEFDTLYLRSSIETAFICGLFTMILKKYLIYLEIDNDFLYSFKEDNLQALLNAFGDIKRINTKPESIIKSSEINNSGLLKDIRNRHIYDECMGCYRNITFKISETCFTYPDKIFKTSYFDDEIILSIKLNKKIECRTIIEPKFNIDKILIYSLLLFITIINFVGIFNFADKGYWNYVIFLLPITIVLLFYLFILFNGTLKKSSPKVLFENPKFPKRFNVYSSNQDEARYLITTAFMERFYNLKTAFGANKIKGAFFDDTLMIAIKTKKKFFEIGSLYKSFYNPDSIKHFYIELNSIYEIIDCLKLYENIGL